MALLSGPKLFYSREDDADFSTVAPCHSFAARTNALMRHTSRPQSELIREEMLANRAQISRRETAATKHNSPNLFWRPLVSSMDRGPFQPADNFGYVGGQFHVLRKALLG